MANPAAPAHQSLWSALALAGGLLLAASLAAGCGADSVADPADVLRLRGRTMGTSYSITAVARPGRAPAAAEVEAAADSLLAAINAEVNTYDPTSMISRVNAGDTVSVPAVAEPAGLHHARGSHLAVNLALAAEPHRKSGGAFDPTVGPLVEYYGFGAGFADTSAVDTAEVARLRQLVGFGNVATDTLPGGGEVAVYIRRPGVRLDLAALAKGYAVDQLGELASERFGLGDYFVEIGGETRTRGRSPRGTPWTIGINTPVEGAAVTDLEVILAVGDAAVATSGNYRNVRIRGGERLVHTIDPRSGMAKPSGLLSATVLARDCATADAYATACMASGEAAADVLAKADLAGCLIFAGRGGRFDTRYVGDFAEYVLEDQPTR